MKNKKWYSPLKCGRCGKFISKPADSYSPFGGYDDIDPPDDVLLCEKCVKSEIEFCRKYKMMPQHYGHADYEEALAKELGFEFVIEEGCAWGRWIKKETE